MAGATFEFTVPPFFQVLAKGLLLYILLMLPGTDFNDRQMAIIQDIIQNGTALFNVQQIENRFNISNQTARNDLNDLVETRKNGH